MLSLRCPSPARRARAAAAMQVEGGRCAPCHPAPTGLGFNHPHHQQQQQQEADDRAISPLAATATFPASLHWPPRRPQPLTVPPPPMQQHHQQQPMDLAGDDQMGSPTDANNNMAQQQQRQQQQQHVDAFSDEQLSPPRNQQRQHSTIPLRAPTPLGMPRRQQWGGGGGGGDVGIGGTASTSSAAARAPPTATSSPDGGGGAQAGGRADLRKATLLRSLLSRTEELLRPQAPPRATSGSRSGAGAAGGSGGGGISPGSLWQSCGLDGNQQQQQLSPRPMGAFATAGGHSAAAFTHLNPQMPDHRQQHTGFAAAAAAAAGSSLEQPLWLRPFRQLSSVHRLPSSLQSRPQLHPQFQQPPQPPQAAHPYHHQHPQQQPTSPELSVHKLERMRARALLAATHPDLQEAPHSPMKQPAAAGSGGGRTAAESSDARGGLIGAWQLAAWRIGAAAGPRRSS